jgi:hypothetical protein
VRCDTRCVFSLTPSLEETLFHENAHMQRNGRLSDPSLRWMAALYDPQVCAEEPAVPSSTQLSQKVKVFSRGSFACGTTGVGFVTLRPNTMLTNDAQIASMTSASSGGNTASALSAFTNQSNVTGSNSPFSNSAYGATVNLLAWKLVGCVLKVKYAGTELNRGGDMLLFESPNHSSLSSLTYTTMMGFDFTKRIAIDNEWHWVCWTPSFESETQFSVATPSSSAPDELAVVINAAGVAGAPFDYEAWAWFEVVGTNARGASLSFNDPIGYGAVLGAVNQFQQLDSVVGSHGFVAAVEEQLNNMSGVAITATHQQNWAGLAAFLPALKELGTQVLGGAATGLLNGIGYTPTKTAQPKARAPKPPPPPPLRAPQKQPPKQPAKAPMKAPAKKR